MFVGRADAGTCLINGSFIGFFGGIGRLRGRPVEWQVFMRDDGPGDPDFYEITITDFDETVVFFSAGDLVSGDISIVVF